MTIGRLRYFYAAMMLEPFAIDWVRELQDVGVAGDHAIFAALCDAGSPIRRVKRAALRYAHTHYLIAKSSFLSFVPFISSRIHVGVMPRPDHLRLGFCLL